MNKFEMIKWLQNLKDDIGQTQHQNLWHYTKMLDEVIVALEDSEDCISRAAALEIYSDLYWIDERLLNFKSELDKVYDDLRNAPSVIPDTEDSVSKRYLLAEMDDLADEFSEVDENGLHSERWCGIMDSKLVIKNAPSGVTVEQK